MMAAISEPIKVPVEIVVSALVRPTDVLVLEADPKTTPEEARELKGRITEMFPALKVLILGAGLRVGAVVEEAS